MPARLLATVVVLIALCDLGRAQAVPFPRPRPAANAPPLQSAQTDEAEPPSACRLRLTGALAVAPSIPAIEGPGECGGSDLVRLEAVVLANKSRVAVAPPAILRCTLAEAIVQWVREDLAPTARALGGTPTSIDNYSSYDCRGRNRIIGAKLSEHGKANALDIRSIRLANGAVIELTDPQVEKNFRENVRAKACARFMTVLGPGSDGYHENHIHVDLAERVSGHRMCQWDIREPAQENAKENAKENAQQSTETATTGVPLPRPRPRPGRGHG